MMSDMSLHVPSLRPWGSVQNLRLSIAWTPLSETSETPPPSTMVSLRTECRSGRLVIPAVADYGLAVASAVVSAAVVAPVLLTLDKAVIQSAAGRTSIGSAATATAKDFLQRPGRMLATPALRLAFGVCAATYAAANAIETACNRHESSSLERASAKLFGTTAVHSAASAAKDAAFARMFGTLHLSPRVLPLASYGLFAVRDCLTMGASFTLPPELACPLAGATGLPNAQALAAAQVLSPAMIQLVVAPLHLMALNKYNVPTASFVDRVCAVGRTLPQATATRMVRFLFAYGLGGVLNASLLREAHRWSVDRFG